MLANDIDAPRRVGWQHASIDHRVDRKCRYLSAQYKTRALCSAVMDLQGVANYTSHKATCNDRPFPTRIVLLQNLHRKRVSSTKHQSCRSNHDRVGERDNARKLRSCCSIDTQEHSQTGENISTIPLLLRPAAASQVQLPRSPLCSPSSCGERWTDGANASNAADRQ